MLKSVELVNIRRHVHTKIDLGRLTVLVGPNGSGKSTVLEAISVASPGPAQMTPLWRRRAQRMGSQSCRVHLATAEASWAVTPSRPVPGTGTTSPGIHVLDLLLEPSKMQVPCDLAATGSLARDGSNVAAVIADMILARDGRVEAIEAALCDIVPGAVRIGAVREGREAQLLVTFKGVGPLQGDLLSEGTLIAIGLLTALHSTTQPTVVLIDDVDRGLHMDAQHELIAILKRAVETRPDLQIVLTTHSPFIMEGVDADDIVLFGLDAQGACVTGRLHEHPDARRLLELLSPAEMWTSVAEGWLVDRSAK